MAMIANNNQLSPDCSFEHRPSDATLRAEFETMQRQLLGDIRSGFGHGTTDVTEFLEDAELEEVALRCAALRIADADAKHQR